MSLFRTQEEVKRLVVDACMRNTGAAPPPGVLDTEIDAFQARLGLNIPRSLREWLRYSNAPATGYGIVLGLTLDNRNQNIEACYPDYLAFWKSDKGWIPIAGDGCGNPFVVATKEEDGPGNPVLFFEILTDERKPAYVVASDVWHFFWFYIRQSLRESGCAYDDEWPFNKEKVIAADPDLQKYTKYPLPWEVA
jgi:hypothetical protein